MITRVQKQHLNVINLVQLILDDDLRVGSRCTNVELLCVKTNPKKENARY